MVVEDHRDGIMAYSLNSPQSQALTALRTVLLAALPSGIEVVQGQDNLVAEPIAPDFVIITPILRSRLETNLTSPADCAFTGSIAVTTLTVETVALGAINTAAKPTLFGPTVAAGTQITVQLTGTPGGAGTYTVSKSQTVASGPLAAGLLSMTAPTQLTVQCDIHGPASADNAQIVSTVLRSGYGVDLFTATGYDVTPLYAGDPRQTPFLNSESQIERQWSIDAVLQVNPTVYVPQQYASAVSVTVEPPIL